MIQSCRDSDTRKLRDREFCKRFSGIAKIAAVRLQLLNSVQTLKDLSAIPGLRLEKLDGDRAGQYSIRINDQYRICFEWKDGDTFNVEVIDYH